MSVHRMEILNGADRRRNWSNALKEQIVSETLDPDVTVTEVARRHDIDRSLVYRWRRAFGVRRAPLGEPAFLPVEVSDGPGVAEGSSPSMIPSVPASDAGRIEIELADGCLVRVDNQVDGKALARVLNVLARRR